MAQIDVSIEKFRNSCIRNLKYLRLRKSQLLVIKYYLHVSFHDMNFKLTLGIRIDKLSWSMILSTWSRGFF